MSGRGNPNPSPATRIGPGGRLPEKQYDESLTWEIALLRLRQEAREAIVRKTRSLTKRLEIARSLQILEAAAAKPPEPSDEDWQEQLVASIRAKRRPQPEGSDEPQEAGE